MDTNKILSANLLDIIFDQRNKAYGAYDLRNTYATRMSKAVLGTAIICVVIIGFTQISNGKKDSSGVLKHSEGYVLKTYVEPKVIQPKPEPRAASAPVKRTVAFVPPRIVADPIARNPVATIDDLVDASPGTTFSEGTPNTGIQTPATPSQPGPAVQSTPVPVSDDPLRSVQVPSKFRGDWIKFLTKNLDPDVPVNNDAPPGRYTVLIQFVVDREGNVSDIKALTNVGYGMEEEAIRVLKRATKWDPAQQNGVAVKAYHKQPITFEVLGEE